MPRGPTIIVTGTPGTGKSTVSEAIAQCFGLKHINVGRVVTTEGFYESYDEEFDAHVPDEDRLLDYLEDVVSEGGIVLDYHSCDLFPERWADLVVVLSASTEVLYDRLTARGYSSRKIEENMDAEIHRVCEDEAKEAYKEEVVVMMDSNETSDIDKVLAIVRERFY